MSIQGIVPNFGEAFNARPSDKSVTNLSNYHGPSFSESISNIARSANIQVVGDGQAAALSLYRNKEEITGELFSFVNAEEETAEEYIIRIKKLLNEFGKE